MIERFEELLKSVQRDGIDNLLDFIRKSDFYTAPASTRFHGAKEGGLLNHSLNVYDCLERKTSGSEYNIWKPTMENITEDTVIIISLLHDICKTYYYTIEMRNAKNDKGVWEKVPYYTVDDKVPYGHGEKSVMMIEEYIKLKPVERYAIRWHMGAYSGQQDWNTLGTAMEKYPLVLALHQADMEATYLIESKEE
jgi:hypothetical protein